MTTVNVIGSGYVGLVQAAGLVKLGHQVRCTEINPLRLAKLQAGECPIFEVGLHLDGIEFAAEPRDDAAFHFICVQTPMGLGGQANTDFVFKAVANLPKYGTVVVKSTVPVGTCRSLAEEFNRQVLMNPEFLREGSAMQDFLLPDRVVIGALGTPGSMAAKHSLAALYRGLKLPSHRVVYTTCDEAELIKYASNSLLAIKLSFVNELCDFAEVRGIDIRTVTQAVGLDKRVGPYFLEPGPGWGGSCFPKDVRELLYSGGFMGFPTLRAAYDSNDRRINRWAMYAFHGAAVAILGTAFKRGTDDTRRSPGALLAERLAESHRVYTQDYQAPAMVRSPAVALKLADVAYIMTDWPEYTELDWRLYKNLKLVVDTRAMVKRQEVIDAGISYVGWGR